MFLSPKKTKNGRGRGFSLVEALVGAALFSIVAVGIYGAFTGVIKIISVSRTKIVAMDLANERFELIRNLPYEKVGIVGGIPNGVINNVEAFTRSGTNFIATTTIRNIDDPFDGTIGGSPNDLSPADYKIVEIEIGCPTCQNFTPIFVNTNVAPKNLEGASTNGALFIRVFDANGQAVSGASVHIENNQGSVPIVINDTTNDSGMLQVVDTPPGVNAYEITVTKAGYSTEATMTPGAVGNPNPTKPHATVVVQQVTQISFVIDKVSTMNISSITQTCSPVPSIDFNLSGSKLVGLSPDVLKYNQNLVTDGSGQRTLTNMEWDTYPLTFTDTLYDLIGTNPVSELSLAPNTTADVKLIVAPKNPNTLLVSVKDLASGLPVSSSTVRLFGTGYDETLVTDRGFINQTDWSHGGGQSTSTDEARYFSSSNVDVANPVGEIKLNGSFGIFDSAGTLTSSTFDTGSQSNFHQLIWAPADQPVEVGGDSVKMQVASNNDAGTWNFLGPDGTSGSYFTSPSSYIGDLHNDHQFFRYKIYLSTASTTFTPNISDVSFTFSSECVPPGQVAFRGVPDGQYTLIVTNGDYEVAVFDDINVSEPWQQMEVVLSPI